MVMSAKVTEGGFSLIELMIALAIISVIAAIAFPSYQDSIRRGHRAAAQQFMLDVANRQKQFLLDARVYATDLNALGLDIPDEITAHYEGGAATGDCGGGTVGASDGVLCVNNGVTPRLFTIVLDATGSVQSSDPTLTLNQAGTRTPADKW